MGTRFLVSMDRVNRVIAHLTPENASFTDAVEKAPADAILGIKTLFGKDTDPRRVNVCVGAYRTDDGKPYVLKCVRAAQELIAADKSLNLEYLPQRGAISRHAREASHLHVEERPYLNGGCHIQERQVHG